MMLKISGSKDKEIHKDIVHRSVGRKALFSYFRVFTIHGRSVLSLHLSST